MTKKMTKAERERAAIDAGYWFTKPGRFHTTWNVGRGHVSAPTILSTGHASRAAARAAMVAAWEAATA